MTTFYLKYRPQALSELDIVSVRNQLKKIVESGSIPHALLFTGTRGTGKTSTARIIAKIINCERPAVNTSEPCNKCNNCNSITNGTSPDVIEIDAASNRGIDDIRILRETVRLSPANSKAKVYIVDEAHMLTVEASNALLKTLEEPPSHVYFILATTNPEKIIETIKSRAQIINFTKATPEETVNALKKVVKSEKIKINDDDLKKIAKISKGSFRDAVKALEQYSKDPSVVRSYDLNGLVLFLSEYKLKNALDLIQELSNQGVTGKAMTEGLLEILRNELLSLAGIGKNEYEFNKEALVALIMVLVASIETIKYSPIDTLPLEVAISKWCNEYSHGGR